jgi:cardiolipin synthase (CMP-forming)
VFRIPAELQHVPLGDAKVFEHLPRAVWRALRFHAAQLHREIGQRRIEISVRPLSGENPVKLRPKQLNLIHAPYDKCSGMWLTIPNLVTLVRIIMTPFILIELSKGEYMIGGWMFGGAAFTDVLDGGLARRFGRQSKFGQYLDPIADKILLSCIYVGLAIGGAMPVWVVVLIFARDVWILSLSGVALKFTQYRNLEPSAWGKASTFFQIMAAVGVMAGRAYENQVFLQISTVLIWGVAILAAVSGIDYSLRGIGYLRGGRAGGSLPRASD